MRTLVRKGALSVAGLCLLSACGGQVIASGHTTVLVSESAGDGMEALGGGQVEVVGGCLGASGNVIVWPHGTEVVNDNPLTIDIPKYGVVAVGDDVQVAGGFVLEHKSGQVEPGPYQAGGVTVPANCAKHDIFVAH